MLTVGGVKTQFVVFILYNCSLKGRRQTSVRENDLYDLTFRYG